MGHLYVFRDRPRLLLWAYSVYRCAYLLATMRHNGNEWMWVVLFTAFSHAFSVDDFLPTVTTSVFSRLNVRNSDTARLSFPGASLCLFLGLVNSIWISCIWGSLWFCFVVCSLSTDSFMPNNSFSTLYTIEVIDLIFVSTSPLMDESRIMSSWTSRLDHFSIFLLAGHLIFSFIFSSLDGVFCLRTLWCLSGYGSSDVSLSFLARSTRFTIGGQPILPLWMFTPFSFLQTFPQLLYDWLIVLDGCVVISSCLPMNRSSPPALARPWEYWSVVCSVAVVCFRCRACRATTPPILACSSLDSLGHSVLSAATQSFLNVTELYNCRILIYCSGTATAQASLGSSQRSLWVSTMKELLAQSCSSVGMISSDLPG